MTFCEQSLWLIGRHMAARASQGEDAIPLDASVSPDTRIDHETARQARALAEDVRDPEIRRLLRELADRYERTATPEGKRPHPSPVFWK